MLKDIPMENDQVVALRLDVAMRTDRGRVRQNNQDAIAGDPRTGLMLLASGMAVDLLMNQLVATRPPDAEPLERETLLNTLQDANHAIFDLAQNVPEYHGMGTTLVLALVQGQELLYAHVGDSRLYRLHQGHLEQLTQDHTLLQELLQLGEFASMEEALEAGVPKNILSRAFGVEAEVLVDQGEIGLSAGDILLLCSDGLTNMLADGEISVILQAEEGDLMARVDRLIEQANERGGEDNISVILVKVLCEDER